MGGLEILSGELAGEGAAEEVAVGVVERHGKDVVERRLAFRGATPRRHGDAGVAIARDARPVAVAFQVELVDGELEALDGGRFPTELAEEIGLGGIGEIALGRVNPDRSAISVGEEAALMIVGERKSNSRNTS